MLLQDSEINTILARRSGGVTPRFTFDGRSFNALVSLCIILFGTLFFCACFPLLTRFSVVSQGQCLFDLTAPCSADCTLGPDRGASVARAHFPSQI